MKKDCLRFLCALLFLGLCIAMLSKDTVAYAADSSAKLNVKTVSIIKDGSFRLKVYNLAEGETVVFRSSDASIATVSSTGTVRGVSFGTATITAIVMNGETAKATLQCDVLIGPAAVSVKFSKSEIIVPVGKTKTLKVQVTPLNTVESPVFYSTDKEIATVSSVGRVRAKETGIVQVYAFLSNKQAAVCDIIVLSENDYNSYLDGKPVEEIMEELSDIATEEPSEEPETPETPASDNTEESVTAEAEEAPTAVTEETPSETDAVNQN